MTFPKQYFTLQKDLTSKLSTWQGSQWSQDCHCLHKNYKAYLKNTTEFRPTGYPLSTKDGKIAKAARTYVSSTRVNLCGLHAIDKKSDLDVGVMIGLPVSVLTGPTAEIMANAYWTFSAWQLLTYTISFNPDCNPGGLFCISSISIL